VEIEKWQKGLEALRLQWDAAKAKFERLAVQEVTMRPALPAQAFLAGA
jgi:hypothetical protein